MLLDDPGNTRRWHIKVGYRFTGSRHVPNCSVNIQEDQKNAEDKKKKKNVSSQFGFVIFPSQQLTKVSIPPYELMEFVAENTQLFDDNQNEKKRYLWGCPI